MPGLGGRRAGRVIHRAIVAAVVAMAVVAGVASAHALPQSSSPSAGSSLEQAPSQVSIVFGERPDPKLSSIKVLDTSGASVTSGPTTVSSGNEDELVIPLKPLPAGVYTVAWRTVSAVDGHNAAGSFAFGVGGETPPPGSSGGGPGTQGAGLAAGPSGAAVAARWLLYVGLIALLGAAFFGAVVGEAIAAVPRRLVPAAWIAAVIGTAAVIGVELSEAGVDASNALQTSFGPTIVERIVPLVVAALGIGVVAARPARTQLALAVVAAAAAAAMLADVGASHAAAGALPILSVAIQWVHVVAVGAWFGGLGGLLLSIRRDPSPATASMVKRFSYVATVGIATVAGTGVLRAIAEVGTIDQLLSTDFGHLVILKTGFLGLLAVLGAVNHFVNVPAAGRRLEGLRRVGSTEVLVAATVVLVSATLVNLAPPVEANPGGATAGPSGSPAPTLGPLVVSGNDFGTSTRLSLAVSPGAAGFNTFTATVTDFDTGAPVPASSVTLRFSIPSRPDIGSSRLDLTQSGTGVFSGTGANLSIDGTWSVAATVVNGLASVEVPLTIATRCPPVAVGPLASVSINAAPGLPTLYTAAFSGGRTVQVYLDPGTAGANEEHATFFDAAGNELPVQTVTMSLGPAGCALAPLAPRQLEPGHFVADTTLQSGTYTTSISGPAPNGDQLSVQFEITVK